MPLIETSVLSAVDQNWIEANFDVEEIKVHPGTGVSRVLVRLRQNSSRESLERLKALLAQRGIPGSRIIEDEE